MIHQPSCTPTPLQPSRPLDVPVKTVHLTASHPYESQTRQEYSPDEVEHRVLFDFWCVNNVDGEKDGCRAGVI